MTDVCFPRTTSQNVARMMMGQGLRGRPTERWQDKSREVRGRRLVGNGNTNRHFARCASHANSLHNQDKPWRIGTRHTSRHVR